MLEKEWVTNDKGQIVAIWVQRDKVTPVKFDFIGVTTNDSEGSLVFPSTHTQARCPISPAIREVEPLRISSSFITPAASKGGNWSRFYTALKSVLP